MKSALPQGLTTKEPNIKTERVLLFPMKKTRMGTMEKWFCKY